MNFKHGLMAASLVGSAALGSTVFATSAEALIIGGDPSYNNDGSLPTTLSVTGEFTNGDTTGGFGDLSSISVGDLMLNSLSPVNDPFNATYNATTAYVTGFTYATPGGAFVNAQLDLDASEEVIQIAASGVGAYSVAFNFTGNIVDAATKQMLGTVRGGLTAGTNDLDPSSNNFSLRINATPVPTPALLPGLIGMGVAALRRKQNETAEETA